MLTSQAGLCDFHWDVGINLPLKVEASIPMAIGLLHAYTDGHRGLKKVSLCAALYPGPYMQTTTELLQITLLCDTLALTKALQGALRALSWSSQYMIQR